LLSWFEITTAISAARSPRAVATAARAARARRARRIPEPLAARGQRELPPHAEPPRDGLEFLLENLTRTSQVVKAKLDAHEKDALTAFGGVLVEWMTLAL